MISNACATIRTAKSFFPLLRPFIIKLHHHVYPTISSQPDYLCTTKPYAPVDQALDNRHLGLLELLLGITASGVGKVDGVTDLDVISQ